MASIEPTGPLARSGSGHTISADMPAHSFNDVMKQLQEAHEHELRVLTVENAELKSLLGGGAPAQKADDDDAATVNVDALQDSPTMSNIVLRDYPAGSAEEAQVSSKNPSLPHAPVNSDILNSLESAASTAPASCLSTATESRTSAASLSAVPSTRGSSLAAPSVSLAQPASSIRSQSTMSALPANMSDLVPKNTSSMASMVAFGARPEGSLRESLAAKKASPVVAAIRMNRPPLLGNLSESSDSDGQSDQELPAGLRFRLGQLSLDGRADCKASFSPQNVEQRFKHLLNIDLGNVFSFWALHTKFMIGKVAFKEKAVWIGNGKSKNKEAKGTSRLSGRAHHLKTGDYQRKPSIASHITSRSGSAIALQQIIALAEEPEMSSRLKKFIMSPGSHVRICWDLAGAVLLAFDIIMIPMSAFSPSRGLFVEILDWTTLLFWTCDIAASCLTGYMENGETVLDPKRIFRNYLKTWLPIDVIVVGPDWTCTIMDLMYNETSTTSAGDTGKLLRAVRAVRMTRMVRLVKLKRVMSMIRDRIDSEHVFIIAGIAKLLALLVIVNHFLASLWYGIGDYCREAGLTNWIDFYDFDNAQLADRYFVSFHWSLTQFSPASMEVYATNVWERVYSITCLMFGLVLFSSFISSITASMTQLRNMEGDTSKQFWLLRRYLRQNGIAAELCWRINRYVEFACSEQKHLVPESKIWVLRTLTNQLRQELTYSVSYSCVNLHPLLEVTNGMSRSIVVRLCESAMSLHSYATQDLIMSPGVLSTCMYMIVSGELSYIHVEDVHMPDPEKLLQQPDWICETALFCDEWYTLGELNAFSECRLVVIDGEAFGHVVEKEHVVWKIVAEYAKKFCTYLATKRRMELTDHYSADKMMHVVHGFLPVDVRHPVHEYKDDGEGRLHRFWHRVKETPNEVSKSFYHFTGS